MGEIVGAALVAHAPTIMFSQEERYEINEGKEITLVPGLHQLREEVLDVLKPDTILVFDSHWFSTVEFLVSGHAHRKGKYTSEELPRGMRQVPYDLKGNPGLAKLIEQKVEEYGTRCYACDDPYLPIHYPTVNLLPFLQGDERWLSASARPWRFATGLRRPGWRLPRRCSPPRTSSRCASWSARSRSRTT